MTSKWQSIILNRSCAPPVSAKCRGKMIGNLVMEQLKKLDKVAYIRFASVYRSFEDIKEFGEEIARPED